MKSFLRLTFLFAFTSIFSTAFSQCDGNRYLNLVFTDVEVTEAIPFGNNVTYQGIEQELLLDVYQPVGDDLEERPLLIMVHGGSFVGGNRDGQDVVPLCMDFAKMGYTVASIDYRLGITLSFDNLEGVLTEAVLRGVHDFKAAVRFFRKTYQEDGNPYNIDQDRIVAAGVSAGGFITLHHAYMDEESEIPDVVDFNQPGLGGGIDGESGNPDYSSDVIGVVNIAGALKDTTWMEPEDEPVCNFHGTNDQTVPFSSDSLYFLNQFFVTEVDGSEAVDAKAEELGIAHCFEIYQGAGHVPHASNALAYDTTRSIMSNFLGSLVCPEISLDCDYRELEVSVNEIAASQIQLEVYPNPTKDEIFLRWGERAKALNYDIYDARGVRVKSAKLNPTGDEVRINVNSLADGFYVLHFRTENTSIQKTFLKN
ncbi:T9SS type A sorting domain-containing protein [Halocola ammonii]